MTRGPTTEQLRDDIDRGRTGSKVNATDPAAAPLGTDEEAAGTPLSEQVVQQARDYERAIGAMARSSASGGPAAASAIRLYALIMLTLVALVAASVWHAGGT